MANIKVNFETIEQAITIQKKIARRLEEVEGQINRLSTQIDINRMYSFRTIKNSLQSAKSDVSVEKNNAAMLSQCLNEIIDLYVKTEQEIQNKNTANKNTAESKNSTQEEKDTSFFKWLKTIFKWSEKIEVYENGDFASDGVGYIESLYKFFTGDLKGLTGASDWLDLGDSSISLWKGHYDFFKKKYGENGAIFSPNAQMGVAGLGLFGSLLGFYSSVFKNVDTINKTENIGTAGVIGTMFESGEELVDVGKSTYDLFHVGEKVSDGIYTPQSLYATTAKTYISAISQGFKSYQKYSADGVWDMDDTAATGIELSVAGLGTMVSSLSFGLISEDTFGVTAEEFSEGLENSAKDMGTKAGNYIVDHPELKERYQNSGTIGRTIITFEATVKSLFN